MADPTKIRAVSKDGVTEVRILMNHEMETGQRKGPTGAPVPAHFISEVTVAWNGKVVLQGEFGPAVAKNPYLAFKFKGGASGDKITVSWVDNRGDKRSDDGAIA